MNETDKAILKVVSIQLEVIASQLDNLSDEYREELEKSKNIDIAGEIETLERLAAALSPVKE